MKIVHTCLCGAMTDGLTYQENLLTKYHRRMGHDVTIIASQYEWGADGKKVLTEKTNYRNSDDVKMVRLPLRRGTVDSRLKTYPGLYRAVEAEHPDILFVHSCQFLDLITLARYAKRHSGVRLYVDNHVDESNGVHGWVSRNLLHKGLWRFCIHRIAPYVTRFYGTLPTRVELLQKLYGLPASRCALLILGADDEMVQRAAPPQVRRRIREKYGIKEEDFLLVSGGKIDGYKTQTLLLMEAVRKLPNEKLRLIVFGSISEDLKEKAFSFIDGKKIQYIGWLQAKDTYDHFAAADLVVFPGGHSVFWEQAAAQGIPLLVNDWPGTHHIDLGGNVRFLRENSLEELQQAIGRLLDCPQEYRQMKAAAVEKGMQVFSYARIARKAIEP